MQKTALLMGAQILLRKEDCALSMEQRSNYAAAKDAPIKQSKEECASNMEQRPSDAALKDAGVKLRREEYVGDMEQRSIDAAVKDVQVLLDKEEYASSMGQRSNDAALKDAQLTQKEEEYVGDMEQTAILTKNVLLLHHLLDQILLLSALHQLPRAKGIGLWNYIIIMSRSKVTCGVLAAPILNFTIWWYKRYKVIRDFSKTHTLQSIHSINGLFLYHQCYIVGSFNTFNFTHSFSGKCAYNIWI